MTRTAFAFRKGRRSRHLEHGFTLIEMLVVLTIIGLIMSLVGPRVLNYLSESKVKAAKIQIESFASAMDLYFMDTGQYPSSSEGLTALVQSSGAIQGWNGPYLIKHTKTTNPKKHPNQNQTPGTNSAPYQITSYGADGQEG